MLRNRLAEAAYSWTSPVGGWESRDATADAWWEARPGPRRKALDLRIRGSLLRSRLPPGASHRSVQLKKEPRLLGPRVPLFALEPSPAILEFVSDFLQDPSCHAVALVTEAEELEWYRTIVQSSDSGLALTLLVPKGLLQAERGAFAEATWTDLRVPGDWRRRVRITTLAAAHFSDDGMLTACSRRSLLMPLVPLLLVAKLCSLAFGWGPQ